MRRRKEISIAVALVILVIGLVLLYSAGPGNSLDLRAFRFLNSRIRNPLFDAIMPIITDFKKWRVVVLLVWSALVLFGGARGRWAALMLIPLVVASDQISSHILKPLVARVRPCEVLGQIHLWYGKDGWITTPAQVVQSYKSSFSFPSSHAANITASMLFIGLVYRRTLIFTLIFAGLVSLSRIYIGVHWPLDVLSGISLGAILGWFAYFLYQKIIRSVQGTKPSE